jgi:cell division protein ZapA (FtsZ GTPase activity inhibitor)
MQKIRTTVRIAGKEYTIASTDSEQYVNRVAAWVDRRMNELAVATRLPATQLAVLTAVNAADDMMKSRDEIRRLEAELDELRDIADNGKRYLAEMEQQEREETGIKNLKIGYNRAAEIVDQLEERGIVGPPSGSGNKRDILIFDGIDIG